MDIEHQLSKVVEIVEKRLEEKVRGPRYEFQKQKLTFVVRQIQPNALHLEDANGFIAASQGETGRLDFLQTNDVVAFDNYDVNIEIDKTTGQIKSAILSPKSILYGVNQAKRNTTVKCNMNLLGVDSPRIKGLVNRYLKSEIARSFNKKAVDVHSFVTAQDQRRKAASAPGVDQVERFDTSVLPAESIPILHKLHKVINRNDLLNAVLRKDLKDLDSRRTVRLMIFPDGKATADSEFEYAKKSYGRNVVQQLIDEYRK